MLTFYSTLYSLDYQHHYTASPEKKQVVFKDFCKRLQFSARFFPNAAPLRFPPGTFCDILGALGEVPHEPSASHPMGTRRTWRGPPRARPGTPGHSKGAGNGEN